MTVPGNLSSPLLATAADAAAAGPIKSLRFNRGDSAYLIRTPSSAGNRRTFTISFWVKRTGFGTDQSIFSTGTSASLNGNTNIKFETDNAFRVVPFDLSGSGHELKTTAVLRDPSSFYHCVIAYDTTQATDTNRAKIYINGVQADLATANYPSQNAELGVNSNIAQVIGRYNYATTNYLDAYLADFYLIDGSQLDATSFGAFDDNGVWQAAVYSGTYGTNGFHLLDFVNESTIGNDSSGNNNDFTANNISTTAGAGNDVLFDVPTNGTQSDTGAGGEVSGNYCVLNALAYGGDINAPTNGNLDVTSGTSTDGSILGTFGMSSGKWYFEVTCNNANTAGIGIAKSGVALADYPGQQSEAYIIQTQTPFYKVNNNSAVALSGTFSSGDVIGVAFDADNGNLSFYQNGSVIGSNAYTGLTDGPYLPIVGDSNSTPSIDLTCNFGQRAFAYSAPSGYKALCTTNLPTPTIADGSDYFDVDLYSGTGASHERSNFSFNPDWLWFKSRNTAAFHTLVDSVRGGGNFLRSNTTNAETTGQTDLVTSFDSDGFTMGANAVSGDINQSGRTYVCWAWDAGSSTASNTDGSITSSVRASQTAGFSVVTFTGTGANATVGHGLNAEPYLLLTKCRESGFNWAVYHKSKGNTGRFMLNNNLAFATSSTFWNNTTPTSSVFSVGSFFASGNTFVAYCIAPVAGYSSVGQYTGNGSSSGPFVHTGHRIRWLMVRRADSTGSWVILDSARTPFNPADTSLYADTNEADYTPGQDWADILSNGFKVRATYGEVNASGGTYIYYAVAENPFSANGGLAR